MLYTYIHLLWWNYYLSLIVKATMTKKTFFKLFQPIYTSYQPYLWFWKTGTNRPNFELWTRSGARIGAHAVVRENDAVQRERIAT